MLMKTEIDAKDERRTQRFMLGAAFVCGVLVTPLWRWLWAASPWG